MPGDFFSGLISTIVHVFAPAGFLAPEGRKPEETPQDSPRNIEEDWRRENVGIFGRS